MNKLLSLSRARILNVVGLVAASIGLLLLIFVAGVAPQGVVGLALLLLVVAGLVAFLPFRWTPIIGVVLPLFMLVGDIASRASLVFVLTNLANIVGVLGMVLQMLGLITAVLAGIVATVQNYRGSRPAASR
jgi:hypothetical protein